MNFEPKDIAEKFDKYLTLKGLTFSGIVVGGSALVLLDIIDRSTKDFDLLDSDIPAEILDAAKDFASIENLSEQWLNCGPSELVDYLPKDWRLNLELIFSGESLTLHTIAMLELLKAKVWAYCDRTKDYTDIIAMAPSSEELEVVREWLYPLDAHPGCKKWFDKCIEKLNSGLNYG